jgi:hypothetical protein
MAKTPATDVPATPTNDADEWETVSTGLGREHNVEEDGPMTGNYLGSREVPIERYNDDGVLENVETRAYQFAPDEDPSDVVFVWESAEIRSAFESDAIAIGDRVRIRFLGRENFTGKNNKPQQIKRYKVERAKTRA